MPMQMSFLDTAPDPKHRYFFGIYVEPAVAERIAAMTRDLRHQHALRGEPLLVERLHVTLHHLGDYDVEHKSIVTTALEAGSAVQAASFDVELDRTASFGGKKLSPFVLTGMQGVVELKAFQRILGGTMARAGLGKHVEKNFTPHVTLLYDAKRIDQQEIEPISWTVREFALVHSLLGETKHTVLGRWTLRG
jgi:2'-5' RNA ligase